MSLSYVKRGGAAVFVLPSEHESPEARFGPARRHMSNCTMCMRVCESLWLSARVIWQIVLSVSHRCDWNGMQTELAQSEAAAEGDILWEWKLVCERECERRQVWERERINEKNECVCAPHGGTGGLIWRPTHGTLKAPCPKLSNLWTLRNFLFYCPERSNPRDSERMNFVCVFASKLKLNTHI